MSEPYPQATPPVNAGGVSAIDLTDEKDRGMVRNAMRHWPRRWAGITADRKAAFVDGLVEANEAARKLVKDGEADIVLKAAGTLASVARTAAMMEAQVQADEHLEDKNARIDAGLATDRVDSPSLIVEVHPTIRPRLTDDGST